MITKIDRVRKNTDGHTLIRTLCIKEKCAAICLGYLEHFSVLGWVWFFSSSLFERNCSCILEISSFVLLEKKLYSSPCYLSSDVSWNLFSHDGFTIVCGVN